MIPTRLYGNTGLAISSIGVGCYRITSGGREKNAFDVDEKTAVSTLQRAYELGVRFFDSAPSYGNGQSHQRMGLALGHLKEDEVIIATKLSGPPDDLDNYTYDSCMRSFERTLKDLKRDYVHILQIHGRAMLGDDSVEEFEKREWDRVFGNGMAYEALLKIREQGGCRYIGITADWAPHLQKALEYADFDSIEIAMHYNSLCNVARETVLPVAEKKNVAVIIATPLSDGRLVSLDAVAKSPHPGVDSSKALEILGQVMNEMGCSLPQLSLLYLLADPRVTSVIPGPSNVFELESNVAVADLNPLNEDQVRRLRTIGSTERGHIGRV